MELFKCALWSCEPGFLMLLMHFSLGLVLGSPNFIWLQKINFLLTTTARFKREEVEAVTSGTALRAGTWRTRKAQLKNNTCVFFFPPDCLSIRKEIAILKRNKSESRLLVLSQPMT